MSNRLTIAVDVMGGDFGPRITLPAIARFLSADPHIHLHLMGDPEVVAPFLSSLGQDQCRCALVACSQQVGMEEKPSSALRNKQDSSLYRMLESVAAVQADVALSAGNTGALMAMAWKVLGMLEGVERPAIATAIPTRYGHSYLLDVGANLEAGAAQLVQFAQLGAALAMALDELSRPRVALLNVGVEHTKGIARIQEAARVLEALSAIEFRGYVEGNTLFSGSVDVIVCDGFSGNVALKTGEGVARLLLGSLKEYLQSRWHTRVLAAALRPALRSWARRFEPGVRNGAMLLGLRGGVIKSHGGADEDAFLAALHYAAQVARHRVPQRLAQSLAKIQAQA
ncbi:phosphate acyltransferase PlsX [Balneatrix alpica]|uniref:phosphate acyltransferase PlsX n=1 Tax=Balneatrix alpica TaxID=75684 RepID=UPI00273A17DC|nr:phosphate acyltransferase PlsX [Balneatrix alpica]